MRRNERSRSVPAGRLGSLLAATATVFTGAALLAACGSSDDAAGGGDGPARLVELEAVEFAFLADEAITITEGDTVEFRVRNAGELEHELEVLNAENRSLGKTERIPPGATRSVTVTFDEAGTYQVICDIDDHRRLGQNAQFDVAAG